MRTIGWFQARRAAGTAVPRGWVIVCCGLGSWGLAALLLAAGTALMGVLLP